MKALSKLEVLDLHGNQISHVTGLDGLNLLKVLNLAGNSIKTIAHNDLRGLSSLNELNLRRNKLKKLFGFENTPQLQKIYLSNNSIQKIEDIGSIAKALQLKEITIDGNPVSLNVDCVSFLVSYLPNLQILSTMQVNEHVRRTAMAWRTVKEKSNSAFLDLSTEVCLNAQREEIISNVKSNWELLRSQTNCFNRNSYRINTGSSDHLRGYTFQSSNKIDICKLKNSGCSKTKEFGSSSSINKYIETRKLHNNRSNSTDNSLEIGNSCHDSALQFKLPPILVPIIDKLKKKFVDRNSPNTSKPSSDGQDCTDTSNSDGESLESHQSLKLGLREHLMKPAKCAISIDYDISGINRTIVKKNNTQTQNVSLLASHDNENEYFLKDCRNKNSQESQSQCQLKSNISSCECVLSFEGGSFSNKKSIFGDLGKLFVGGADKPKITDRQVKKTMHYKSNRAASARKKHKAISIPNVLLQPSPSADREQGENYDLVM